MKPAGIVATIVAVTALWAVLASAPVPASSPARVAAETGSFAPAPELACEASTYPTPSYTCHEECRIRCIQLYPGNPGMQNLCTWSCIDAECGGGPFPVQ
ncbi:MAG TPA: hypothetical protein VK698_25435 [Kofleriaceae bacterium]|nr:hypothetical protein [Kofleriaceae bacterium]